MAVTPNEDPNDLVTMTIPRALHGAVMELIARHMRGEPLRLTGQRFVTAEEHTEMRRRRRRGESIRAISTAMTIPLSTVYAHVEGVKVPNPSRAGRPRKAS